MPLLSARRHAVHRYFVSVLDFFPPRFRLADIFFVVVAAASQPHTQIRRAANQSTCAVKTASMSRFANQ